jgi:hypothetical protein
VKWQYCGGGTYTSSSRISTLSGASAIGAAANMPPGFTSIASEEFVVGEAFYNYAPISSANGVLGSMVLYRTAVFMPRLGALSGFSSHC